MQQSHLPPDTRKLGLYATSKRNCRHFSNSPSVRQQWHGPSAAFQLRQVLIDPKNSTSVC